MIKKKVANKFSIINNKKKMTITILEPDRMVVYRSMVLYISDGGYLCLRERTYKDCFQD